MPVTAFDHSRIALIETQEVTSELMVQVFLIFISKGQANLGLVSAGYNSHPSYMFNIFAKF